MPPGNKPLSEPVLTQMYGITRPQWVKRLGRDLSAVELGLIMIGDQSCDLCQYCSVSTWKSWEFISVTPGRTGFVLKMQFPILFHWLVSSGLLMIMPLDESYGTWLMISKMMILLNDRSVGDHGFWQSMIDHENYDWSFSIMEQADSVLSVIINIYIFGW